MASLCLNEASLRNSEHVEQCCLYSGKGVRKIQQIKHIMYFQEQQQDQGSISYRLKVVLDSFCALHCTFMAQKASQNLCLECKWIVALQIVFMKSTPSPTIFFVFVFLPVERNSLIVCKVNKKCALLTLLLFLKANSY